MYNPLQARDPLGKWVKEHGGASIEDVVSKTSMVDLENMALDDRTPTAVLNNLATTEYGFNHPFDEDKTYPNANGEPPKDARENRYNYEQQLVRYDAKVRCTAIERGADDTALSVCRFDYNPQIRNAVARNTDDARTLDVLSSDESWKVRGAVAGNPHTPKNATERLLNDDEAIVRAEALKRSDLSSEQIRKAVDDSLEPALHGDGAVTDDMTKITRAASDNWQADADTLHECLRVDDYETQRNVAEHEHTFQEVCTGWLPARITLSASRWRSTPCVIGYVELFGLRRLDSDPRQRGGQSQHDSRYVGVHVEPVESACEACHRRELKRLRGYVEKAVPRFR